MGNPKDGKLPGTWVDCPPPLRNGGLDKKGNPDAQILGKAFEEFSKDGLTANERKKIEAFDDILKDADIVVNKEGTAATIVQDDGQTFTIKGSRGRG